MAFLFNPLTPGFFCQKRIFWHFGLRFSGWIWAKLALMWSKRHLQHDSLPVFLLASRFTTLWLRHAHKWNLTKYSVSRRAIFYHALPRVVAGNFALTFSLTFLRIFVRISGSIAQNCVTHFTGAMGLNLKGRDDKGHDTIKKNGLLLPFILSHLNYIKIEWVAYGFWRKDFRNEMTAIFDSVPFL